MNGRTQLTIPRHSAFSLIELVIVIAIIGVIAAIAVPRFTKATQNSTRVSARNNCQQLRSALDLFLVEHPEYLTTVTTSAGLVAALNPDASGGTATNILINLTDTQGAVSGTGAFGPYMDNIPSNALVHSNKAVKFQADATDAPDPNTDVGWAIDYNNKAPKIGYYASPGDPPLYPGNSGF